MAPISKPVPYGSACRETRRHGVPPYADYTHMAFIVAAEDFASLSERLIAEYVIWKENVSEGGSTYFLDPDGHKLEIHVGSLETRLAHYRDNPSKGVRVFDA